MQITERLNPQQELEIVARIARGDKYAEIAEDYSCSLTTIGEVKKRNPKALAIIQSRMVEHEAHEAIQIKKKANSILRRKLDRIEKDEDRAEQLYQSYMNGHLSLDEYERASRRLAKTTLTELTAVSKEMNSQAKEDGEGGNANPAETQAHLQAIMAALEKGDTVTLQQLVLTPKGN